MLTLLDTFSLQTLFFLAGTGFLAGLARGFSGFGAALVFVPIASALAGPQIAVPVLLVIDGLSSLGLVPAAWTRADKRDVSVMALGALVGVPLGTWILTQSDPVTMRWAIAVLSLSLLALLMSGWRYHGRPVAPLTVGVGGVAGVFSGAAQVGGPPVVAYWLGGAIPAETVRANLILYFLISSALTGVAYLAGGLLNASIIVLALIIGPLFALGLYLGSRLFGRAPEEVFRRVCYALIGGAALVSLPMLDSFLR